MNARAQHYAELAVGLVVLVLVWWHFTPKPAPVGTTALATPAKEIKGKPKHDITPPKVSVYTPPAKTDLGLPDAIKLDDSLHVLDSTDLPADTHPHTVTTVIDEDTGEVQTFDRRDPLPWFKPERHGELRIDYGYKTGLVQVWRIGLREDLLQVKALHAGLSAALDTDGAVFIGVGVGWRW